MPVMLSVGHLEVELLEVDGVAWGVAGGGPVVAGAAVGGRLSGGDGVVGVMAGGGAEDVGLGSAARLSPSLVAACPSCQLPLLPRPVHWDCEWLPPHNGQEWSRPQPPGQLLR